MCNAEHLPPGWQRKPCIFKHLLAYSALRIFACHSRGARHETSPTWDRAAINIVKCNLNWRRTAAAKQNFYILLRSHLVLYMQRLLCVPCIFHFCVYFLLWKFSLHARFKPVCALPLCRRAGVSISAAGFLPTRGAALFMISLYLLYLLIHEIPHQTSFTIYSQMFYLVLLPSSFSFYNHIFQILFIRFEKQEIYSYVLPISLICSSGFLTSWSLQDNLKPISSQAFSSWVPAQLDISSFITRIHLNKWTEDLVLQ